jgi:hypothetical protein
VRVHARWRSANMDDGARTSARDEGLASSLFAVRDVRLGVKKVKL